MAEISGEVFLCSGLLGVLVGVLVFRVTRSEFCISSAMRLPLWSCRWECHSCECALKSPAIKELGKSSICCTHVSMLVSSFWWK